MPACRRVRGSDGGAAEDSGDSDRRGSGDPEADPFNSAGSSVAAVVEGASEAAAEDPGGSGTGTAPRPAEPVAGARLE